MYGKLITQLKANPVRDPGKLAHEVLKHGNLLETGGLVPVIDVANEFGFKVYEEPDMPKNISGNVYVNGDTRIIYGNNKIIVVGDDLTFFEQRFIIAYELGRYLIDFLANPEYTEKPHRLFSVAYRKKANKTDRFAMKLLMPEQKFRERYAHALRKSKSNMAYAVTYLYEYFEVPRDNVIYRINEI